MASFHPGTALVTGASSGMGAIYADRLARRGYDLILAGRDRERLEQCAASLAKREDRTIRIVAADLQTAQGLNSVEQILCSERAISMLVNNAGIGAVGPLLQSDINQLDALIRLDVIAPVRLAYAAAAAFASRGSGTIVNMASIVAVAPELLNGVYGAAKAFVLAFSQSLHHELSDKGIRIQVVLPGAVATAFWGTAGTSVEHLPADIVMSAEDAVDAALAGLDAGEVVTIPSLPDLADWQALEDARKNLFPGLSHAIPAPRYRGL
ncbi:SDR family NAD(P)-dependent oxidoreductase [Sphingomonas quercus]|uniref:SDR family oxidoreductase n=1 Tax=Sphingomonas quercus TaxID=2842451 RepID=A0ABS6BNQ0_9SPHN|nr:SDR family oxidoreductase [Sphingomonas quercus]MBU3078820.1 SDR family oxidoreductase [Sphingomonas quercus]